jgi:hypothetical protein
MMALLMALLFSVFCGIDWRFSLLVQCRAKRWIISYVIRFSLCFLILWPIFYFGLPGITGPGGGVIGGVIPFIIIFWGVSIFFSYIEGKSDYYFPVTGTIIWVIIAGSSFFVATCPGCMFSESLKNIGNVQKAEPGEFKPLDIKHIRTVPLEYARWKADKILGESKDNLGSMFSVGNLTIQRVKGKLYWVAPLDFKGFSSWTSADFAPGFVMVDAEDERAEAELHTGYKLKYMPEAYFGDNLHRHVYFNGYITYNLMEVNFEVDDNLNPFWVIAAVRPTIGWTGEKVQKALIVNPSTGEITSYLLNETPDWVDRVVPEELVKNYLIWWGKYAHGWVNSWWSHKDVIEPTDVNGKIDVYFSYSSSHEPCWVTGMTSSNEKDQALVGFATLNSRTGEAYYYSPVNGVNENAALQRVNDNISYKNWHGTEPILYQVYGQKTWIIPVLAQNKTWQGIALAHSSQGEMVFGADLSSALAEYRKLLSNIKSIEDSGPSATGKNQVVAGKVNRVVSSVLNGNTVFYLQLDSYPQKLFLVDPNKFPEVLLTEAGGSVSLEVLNTNEAVIPTEKFVLEGFQLERKE